MNLMNLLDLASLVAGIGSLVVTGYLGVLALLAFEKLPKSSPAPELHFAIVVPSHNEQAGIADTVESLLALDWPRDRFDVVVVADNCDDATAQRAEAAGARVLERFNDEKRGKGYALELAFETLLAEGKAEAFVVVDADTLVDRHLLRSYAARLADGEHAVQAEYGVRNVEASWRTRLMAVALAMFHGVRSWGRERLGLSVGLRGNGMCFSRALLLKHPHEAYGLVEDVEYGIRIGLGGYRVAYAGEARVLGEMVSSAAASESQRRRWEGGRMALMKSEVPRLLAAFVKRPRLMLLDLAMDLLVPPLSYVGLMVGLGVAAEIVLTFLRGGPGPGTWVWLANAGGLGLYVLRGIQLSGLGFGAVLALAWAPVYVFWKIARVRPWKKDGAWVRTKRESEEEGADGDG